MRPRRVPFLAILILLPRAPALGLDPAAAPAPRSMDPAAPAAAPAAPLEPPATLGDVPPEATGLPTRSSAPEQGARSGARRAWWSAAFQATYVVQRKTAFDAAYTGPNSLVPSAETGYTLSSTLFLGLRPWPGAELFLDPEAIQSADLSHLSGLGGLSNGEDQKGGGPLPRVYLARAFLRQTIALGGELSAVEPGANQVGGLVSSRRLVLTAGNFSWADVFDANALSHDPRTQFLNWAFMSYGASDYAADVRGYTWGIALEYHHDDWVVRGGRFAQPRDSNGLAIDFRLLAHHGDTLEVEHGHMLWGRPGTVRLAGFRNVARMGGFRDALRYAAASGGVPDVAAVRREQSKCGFGASLEQEVLPDVGLFLRYSHNDGRTETYAFAEIERSLTAGASVTGRRWNREGDAFGVAWAVNGLSPAHRDYLRAGGLGFLIGDGRLTYRPEQILEAYYSFNASRGFWVTVDAQRVANPAYNADRGPVNIVGARFHVEY